MIGAFNKYDLPVAVEIAGRQFKIRNNCDYRIVLQCIEALNDQDLTEEQRAQCALVIFYEDYDTLTDPRAALEEMFRIISYNDGSDDAGSQKPVLMDWGKDFAQIAPPVSRIIGYDVRTPGKYTHWWSFLGSYLEIGECTFSTIVSIRSKKIKGKKLEKWEEEFYRGHYDLVNLPTQYTQEEQEILALFK